MGKALLDILLNGVFESKAPRYRVYIPFELPEESTNPRMVSGFPRLSGAYCRQYGRNLSNQGLRRE